MQGDSLDSVCFAYMADDLPQYSQTSCGVGMWRKGADSTDVGDPEVGHKR